MGLTDYFDIDLLNTVMQKCAAAVDAPLSFVSADGSIVVKKNFPEYAMQAEESHAQDMKMRRAAAFEQEDQVVQYIDGTESVMAAVKLDRDVIGAVVLGPFITNRIDITIAGRIAQVPMSELNNVLSELKERKPEHSNAAVLLANTVFQLAQRELAKRHVVQRC